MSEDSQETKTEEQKLNSRPWLFQPGQSGNPGGRPRGSKSLKTYAKEYLYTLSDEGKLDYLAGMDKKDVWEMGEGKAKQDLDISGEITSKVIKLDE